MKDILASIICLVTCTDPAYTPQDEKLFHEACRSISVYTQQTPSVLKIESGKYTCIIKKRRFNEDEMRAMLRLNKARRNQNTVSWYN